MNPRVKDVVPKDGYVLELLFENGQRGLFDVKKFFNLPVFESLKDLNYFRQVRALFGSVVWPDGQDICPDTLYEDSLKVNDTRP